MIRKTGTETTVSVQLPLYRGERRVRIALAGMPLAGKSTLFQAVSSTSVQSGELSGTQSTYKRCIVQVGMDEASVVDLPSVHSFFGQSEEDLVALKYLLWGDQLPPISAHEPGAPPAPFAPPDVIVQVVDAASLDRHLEMTLELCELGQPLVLALNRTDEARARGIHISADALSRKLGIPVVETVATKGHGISTLFEAAVKAVRDHGKPLPPPTSAHILAALQPLKRALEKPEVGVAFRVPAPFLLSQIASGNPFFRNEMKMHFPALAIELESLRLVAEGALPTRLTMNCMRIVITARLACSKVSVEWAVTARTEAGVSGLMSCFLIRAGDYWAACWSSLSCCSLFSRSGPGSIA